MTDKTIRDLVESEIRITGIWNVKATMFFEGVFDWSFDFHDTLKDGELHELLDIPSDIEDEDELAEYIENDLDPELLVIEVSSPVKKPNQPHSWGLTRTYHAKGKTLQELYNNAYYAVYPKEQDK